MILSAYADDVVVLIKDREDINTLANMPEKSNVVFSTRVNWEKSEVLAFGEWCEELPVLPRNLVGKQDGLKYLSLFLGNEDKERKRKKER